ncbi:MAG: hypothetical protein CMO44_09975 [Verrucomicrobiales bacterium]|nr:hypothetical protein [Verrucomicrobiales bacterium]
MCATRRFSSPTMTRRLTPSIWSSLRSKAVCRVHIVGTDWVDAMCWGTLRCERSVTRLKCEVLRRSSPARYFRGRRRPKKDTRGAPHHVWAPRDSRFGRARSQPARMMLLRRLRPPVRTMSTLPLGEGGHAAAAEAVKQRVVVLGTGWGGNRLARTLCKDQYDVTVISPSNHFLVTPLLPQTAVGTLEFRNVQEPARSIKGVDFFQAKAQSVDLTRQVLSCEECIADEHAVTERHQFQLPFDVLIIATGCKTDTFNTPGVAEAEGREVHFLKHIKHARGIRLRMLECFERAAMPGVSDAERDRLLSFVVVGGGPTSCEFTAELHDFLASDAGKWAYPELMKHVSVTLVEAGPQLMPAFDTALVSHMMEQLKERDVTVRIGTRVKALEKDATGCTNVAVLSSDHVSTPVVDGRRQAPPADERLRFGMLVWAAGLQQVNFVRELYSPQFEIRKGVNGRLVVDQYMRVLINDSADNYDAYEEDEADEAGAAEPAPRTSPPLLGGRVYAIGDCAANEHMPLPPTAQVAEQQADYLAAALNQGLFRGIESRKDLVPLPAPVPPSSFPPIPPIFYGKSAGFRYINRGSMSSVGFGDGLIDMTRIATPGKDGQVSSVRGPAITGLVAFTAWHGYYFSKQYQSINMLLNVIQSFKSRFLRRDISRF